MSEIRQPGWYWVMHAAFDEPQVAQYCPSDGFMIAGISGAFDEDAFESIGPRIPTPDDPWKTVPADKLRRLRDSISGDLYMGEEWELSAIDNMLAAATEP